MFALTLTDIVWNWFEPIKNKIWDMVTLKVKFKKRFNHGNSLYENNAHVSKT